MESFDTEKPLDFDYFHQNEKMDTSTVISFLQEYNKIGGLTVNWYRLQDAERGMDPVFLEKADKSWCRPIAIKAVFQYLEEVIENIKAGISVLDEVNLVIEKTYWTEVTKTTAPVIGDLFYIEHVKLMFEVINLVDSDANFWGNKLVWKILAKIIVLDNEDSTMAQDIIEPGWLPDEQQLPLTPISGQPIPGEIKTGIENKCDELHTYTEGTNPFGNH